MVREGSLGQLIVNQPGPVLVEDDRRRTLWSAMVDTHRYNRLKTSKTI